LHVASERFKEDCGKISLAISRKRNIFRQSSLLEELSMIQNLQIRNPKVLEVVAHEVELGAGRSHTEAAENLILEAVEQRRVRRVINSQASDSREGRDTEGQRIVTAQTGEGHSNSQR
jgi:hypothetical protein